MQPVNTVTSTRPPPGLPSSSSPHPCVYGVYGEAHPTAQMSEVRAGFLREARRWVLEGEVVLQTELEATPLLGD